MDPGEIEGTDLRVLKYPHPKLRAFDEEVSEFDDSLKQVGRGRHCQAAFMSSDALHLLPLSPVSWQLLTPSPCTTCRP